MVFCIDSKKVQLFWMGRLSKPKVLWDSGSVFSPWRWPWKCAAKLHVWQRRSFNRSLEKNNSSYFNVIWDLIAFWWQTAGDPLPCPGGKSTTWQKTPRNRSFAEMLDLHLLNGSSLNQFCAQPEKTGWWKTAFWPMFMEIQNVSVFLWPRLLSALLREGIARLFTAWLQRPAVLLRSTGWMEVLSG